MRRLWTVLKKTVVLFYSLIIMFVCIGGIVAYDKWITWDSNLPPLGKAREISKTSYLLSSTGQKAGSFATAEDRRVIPWDSMGYLLTKGVVSIEDERFYEHHGWDPQGVARAAYINYQGGRQGGSTITQQLLRDLYPEIGKDFSYKRKLREIHYAIQYEKDMKRIYKDRRKAKEVIITKYLNTVFFGSGAYGVEAASLRYFGVKASQLKPAQAAYLIGIIQAPAQYVSSPESGKTRRDLVLKKWYDDKIISSLEYSEAIKQPIPKPKAAADDGFNGAWAGLSRLVIDELKNDYPNIQTSGYKIKTTLQPKIQYQAVKALENNLKGSNMPMGAIVIAENSTGKVRAAAQYPAGGWFNSAKQSRRQPGSSAKIWTLVTAVKQEKDFDQLIYKSKPLKVRLANGELWEPKTYSGYYSGSMNMRSATIASDNSVFAQFTLDLGSKNVAQTVMETGIPRKLPAVASIGLGSVDVSPLEQTNFYTTLARGGNHIKLHLVEEIKQGNKVIWHAPNKGIQKYARPGAALIIDYLKDNNQRGTGRAAHIPGYWTAGKTGTTDDYKDAWYCGITLRYTSCVWIGYKNPKPMTDVPGIGRVTGSTIPASVWHDMMTSILPKKDMGKKPKWSDSWRENESWIKSELTQQNYG